MRQPLYVKSINPYQVYKSAALQLRLIYTDSTVFAEFTTAFVEFFAFVELPTVFVELSIVFVQLSIALPDIL